MVTSTVEQYIKILFSEAERSEGQTVSMKQVSDSMQVTPGTATSMAKHLASLGLVEYTPRRGCRLTDRGMQLALRMVRRHRLIETFLERTLEYDWSEVHAEAEQLEHAVSDRFIDRLDRFLSYPETDPHGDPIPGIYGEVTADRTISLAEASEGDSCTIVRILDDSAEFLNLMRRMDLLPGERCVIVSRDSAAGTVHVRSSHTSADELPLSSEAAGRIRVVPRR